MTPETAEVLIIRTQVYTEVRFTTRSIRASARRPTWSTSAAAGRQPPTWTLARSATRGRRKGLEAAFAAGTHLQVDFACGSRNSRGKAVIRLNGKLFTMIQKNFYRHIAAALLPITGTTKYRYQQAHMRVCTTGEQEHRWHAR